MTPRLLREASFRTQVVASTAALVAALMIVVGLGIQLVLELTARQDISDVLTSRAATVVASVRGASADRLTVPQAALEPGVQVYDADGRLLGGTIQNRARDAAEDLAGTTRPVEHNADANIRLRAVPFTTPSGHRAVVVVSLEATPYERSERYALLATILLGVIMVATTAVVARRATDRALVPVSQMASRATEWSEHDLNRRFDLGPPTNELAALGKTLDHLLERVARAIRSEQRLTSEMAHELRTPLTAIQGSADLALMRGVDDPDLRVELEEISAAARTMAATITALLDVAREHARSDGADTCRVGELVPPVHALVPDDLVFVDDTAEESETRLAGPAELVLRALAPLVENAAAHARSEVGLCARRDGPFLRLSVVDDGGGIDAALRDGLFEPGTTGRGGSGLGLGIARRVARSLGGDVVVEVADRTTFTVRVPVA